jgi:hypothetical protein
MGLMGQCTDEHHRRGHMGSDEQNSRQSGQNTVTFADNEATFILIERVFHQAMLDVRSKDHNRSTAAEHWLDCMAPDWREHRRRCRGRGAANLYDLSPVDRALSNIHTPAK